MTDNDRTYEEQKFLENTKNVTKKEIDGLPNQDLEIISGNWLARFFKSFMLLFTIFNPHKKALKLEKKQTNNLEYSKKIIGKTDELIKNELDSAIIELKKLENQRKILKLKKIKWFVEKWINKNNLKTINKRIQIIKIKLETLNRYKNKLIEFKKKEINIEKVNDIEGDLLFLIRQNKIEIYNDIKTGIFEIDKDKNIRIDPSKKKLIKIGGKEYGVFIGSENSYTLYEVDPIYDSYIMTQVIKKLATTLEMYKNLKKPSKTMENIFKYIMYTILGGLAIYGILLLMGVNIFQPNKDAIRQNIIESCWIKTDTNEWIYTCAIPDQNTTTKPINKPIPPNTYNENGSNPLIWS